MFRAVFSSLAGFFKCDTDFDKSLEKKHPVGRSMEGAVSHYLYGMAEEIRVELEIEPPGAKGAAMTPALWIGHYMPSVRQHLAGCAPKVLGRICMSKHIGMKDETAWDIIVSRHADSSFIILSIAAYRILCVIYDILYFPGMLRECGIEFKRNRPCHARLDPEERVLEKGRGVATESQNPFVLTGPPNAS